MLIINNIIVVYFGTKHMVSYISIITATCLLLIIIIVTIINDTKPCAWLMTLLTNIMRCILQVRAQEQPKLVNGKGSLCCKKNLWTYVKVGNTLKKVTSSSRHFYIGWTIHIRTDLHSAKRIVENMRRIHLKRHAQKIPPWNNVYLQFTPWVCSAPGHDLIPVRRLFGVCLAAQMA